MTHEKPDFFWYNPVSGESTWESPFPTSHTDDDGNTFLVDPANHDNTWWEQDPPEEWAWEEAEATEGDNAGSTYYHNKVCSGVGSAERLVGSVEHRSCEQSIRMFVLLGW